jgi:NADPH-ferrihemoprotein reductase
LDQKKTLQKVLGDSFKLYTAFSRQTAKKGYVQHLLSEHAIEVLSLLLDNNGYIYICGGASMAREVQSTLCELVSQVSNVSLSEAEATVRNMKSTGRFQVQIFLIVAHFPSSFLGSLH